MRFSYENIKSHIIHIACYRIFRDWIAFVSGMGILYMNHLTEYKYLTKPNNRKRGQEYYERHHIIPVCMGGNSHPCNLVMLTPAEHLRAHYLLMKMNPLNTKLRYAYYNMKKRITEPPKKHTNKSKSIPVKQKMNTKMQKLLNKYTKRDRRVGLIK